MRPFLLVLVAAVAAAQSPTLGRKVVWEDQFNAPAVDASKWNVGNPELVKVDKGKLVLGFLQTPGGFVGGNVNSQGKFSQQFGYFEASMRMNAGDGHVGTFRIITDHEKTPPSITASFHAAGKERVTPWSRAVTETGYQDFRPDKPAGKFTDLSKKFHTYGILWTDKGFTWFIDGKAVHKLERKEFVRPMSLALTHRIEEQDRPRLVLKTLPDDVDVDWVKVYQ